MKTTPKPLHFGFMLCASISFGMTPFSATAESQYLSAQESDPLEMSWMQGFPPPDDKLLNFADGSFFEFLALRWSVVHMRELMPTVNVSRGSGAPDTLPESLDANIDGLAFRPLNADEDITWEDSLWENYIKESGYSDATHRASSAGYDYLAAV
ncbi:MAG: hypothetical protein ACTHWH_14090 [Marinobacter sp.]